MAQEEKPLHVVNPRCVYKGCHGEAIWTFELGLFNICFCGEHGPFGFELQQKFSKGIAEEIRKRAANN